jgi:hypothetical protein
VRSLDTSPEVYQLQMELYRGMTPARRVELAVEMSEEIWEIAAEGVRARHPEYDETDVRWAVSRMRVGDELFRRAWPNAPRRSP